MDPCSSGAAFPAGVLEDEERVRGDADLGKVVAGAEDFAVEAQWHAQCVRQWEWMAATEEGWRGLLNPTSLKE